MIELRNVTKTYPVRDGIRYVLRDVSLVIPSRSNIAVLGPNGAGKSTFLRLIGGAEAADKGEIIVDSEISWPLGLTSGFQGSLTGRQNVVFVCRINGLGVDQIQDVMQQVTSFAEIGEYFDMPVNTYSSGMRARLSFGLSMAFDFDVYLRDGCATFHEDIDDGIDAYKEYIHEQRHEGKPKKGRKPNAVRKARRQARRQARREQKNLGGPSQVDPTPPP